MVAGRRGGPVEDAPGYTDPGSRHITTTVASPAHAAGDPNDINRWSEEQLQAAIIETRRVIDAGTQVVPHPDVMRNRLWILQLALRQMRDRQTVRLGSNYPMGD